MTEGAPQAHDHDPTLASLAQAADGSPALIAGRYEIRDSIGRGAFGEVFEAYDRVLGRLVAVKVMPIAQTLGPEGRESLRRFQIEARAVSRLTHPNIITVHDFGQGERFAWIVMELVIGETLTAALRRTGPPPLAETSRVICALLAALHAAHERGIVHRDVKPSNILLEMSLDEGLGAVRLSDFGIARTDAEDRTAVGQMMGTPWVMAPEQLRGETVDRRTDLWAVGCILYEMLTGERPFSGTMPGIFHRIQNEDPKPPTLLRAELPQAVDGLIARALAKAPDDRFATAEDMAAAVRDALIEAPRWKDAPPLPGLGPEDPRRYALVPSAPAPPPPAPARRRFGAGLVLGLLGGLLLGMAATRLASLVPVLAVEQRSAVRSALEPPATPPALLSAAPATVPAADSPPTTPGGTTPGEHLAAAALGGVAEDREEPRPADMPAPLPEPPVAAPRAEAPVAPPPAMTPDPPPSAAPPRVAPLAGLGEGPPWPVALAPPLAVREPTGGEPQPAGPGLRLPLSPAAPAPAPEPPPLAAESPVPPPATALQPADGNGARPDIAATTPAPPRLPLCSPERLRIRTGSHDGFGRIVFEWSEAVGYRVTQGDAGITVAFPDAGCRPSAEGVRPARNLRGAEPEANGAPGLVLRIAPGTQLRDFRLGTRVVVDLFDPASR
jgi:serine/threonine-protein kinase